MIAVCFPHGNILRLFHVGASALPAGDASADEEVCVLGLDALVLGPTRRRWKHRGIGFQRWVVCKASPTGVFCSEHSMVLWPW